MRFTLTEQNYRDLFEYANDAMWVQDLDGNFVAANRACEKLTGFDRDELLKRNVKEFLVSDSLVLAQKVAHRLLHEQEFKQPYDQTVVRKDGGVRAIRISTSLLSIGGRPAGFQHIARDVTEERGLAEMLSEITNGSPIPTFVIDKDHKITHWNTALQLLTGLRAGAMVGTNRQWKAFYAKKRPTLADMIVDGSVDSKRDTHYRTKLRKSSLIEGAYEGEDFMSTVGDKGRWLRFTASPIKNSYGKTIAVMEALQDITEEKRMQESMRYYVQLITRAQEEERKRLARDLHDDVSSSLLLLIRGLDSAMPASRSRSSLAFKETIESLRVQAVDALQHVRRYVQNLRPRILDDLGLIASLNWMADDMHRTFSIRTSVSVTGVERGLSAEIQLLLFRIAQEALSNVGRHSRADKAEIALDIGDRSVTMTIRDNGRGFKVPAQIEELAGGGRLGIMGMVERAGLLNGTLNVRSSPDGGTEVVAAIPLPGQDTKGEPGPAESAESGTGTRTG
jgi:two-component system, NarL family, sensor histidine kinase DegS